MQGFSKSSIKPTKIHNCMGHHGNLPVVASINVCHVASINAANFVFNLLQQSTNHKNTNKQNITQKGSSSNDSTTTHILPTIQQKMLEQIYHYKERNRDHPIHPKKYIHHQNSNLNNRFTCLS